MVQTIVVIGATGVQGGGVVSELLKDGLWNIRAVTRNPESDKGKALTAQGVKVVTADLDNTESLIKAFEGASAVYGLTNFWEHVFTVGPDEASKIDFKQGVNIAKAAAATSSLEHYIWATLPSGKKTTGGKYTVPHTDLKAEVDEYIKEKLPALAKKTTFLWHGFYITNLMYLPMLRPTLLVTAGQHILLRPVSGNTTMFITGDPSHNTGVFVKAILAQPALTHGRYTTVVTDVLTIDELLAVWSKVTGKRATSISCTQDEYDKLWPIAGEEFGYQLQFHVNGPSWKILSEGQVSKEELGITGLISTEDSLKALAANWE